MSNNLSTAQHTLSGSTAEQLTDIAAANDSGLLKALPTNSGTVYVGDSTVSSTTGFPLAPGDAISLDFLNIRKIYIRGTSGDKVALLATSP